MKALTQNSMKWTIMIHISRNVWVGSRELFEQFDAAGYRFSSYSSFVVTMSKLKTDGYLDHRPSVWPQERTQFRRAEGIVVERQRPKSPVTIYNAIKAVRRDARHGLT